MHDPQAYWDALVATALIGVQRRPTLPAPPPGPLAQVYKPDPVDPAGALLDQAAATAIYLRAGSIPPISAPAGFVPAPPDDTPACPPAAIRHLGLILDDPQRADLAEWLGLLAAAGVSVPAARLTDMLDLARSNPELRSLIAPVLGARGRWLAGLNPEWRVFGGADDPLQAWNEGDRSERSAALRRIRASDPGQARSLIAAAWPNERADERAAWVEIMATGLSMDDEPWLEAALDDRSREVRRQVALLLARLPASQLAQRMAERAERYLRLSADRPISLTLPDTCDDAMRRDGIEPKAPRNTLGERAWWLLQIIARTAPSFWVRRTGLPPGRIIAAVPDEWRALLLDAWQQAALNYADADWAAALADVALSGDQNVHLELLIGLLPPERRDDLLTWLLAAEYRPSGGELAVLRAAPYPWSDRLGRAAIQAIVRRLRVAEGDQRADWPLRIMIDCANALPPHLAEFAAALLPSNGAARPAWSTTIAVFLERLRFRREMRAALRHFS